MYVLDEKKFKSKIKQLGFNSLSDLATHLNIHRNTLSNLSGKGVFKANFQLLMDRLNLEPLEYVTKRDLSELKESRLIADITDKLSTKFPNDTFVLFGSRTRQSHHRYSDIDIGVFNTKGVLHKHYLQMREFVKSLEEDLPYFIDIVNLCNAEQTFLRKISQDLHFLAGKRVDWFHLKELCLGRKKSKVS